MSKKVLYISTRIFWPTNSGKKITAYFNALGMHKIYNYDVYVYAFKEVDQVYDEATKPEFIKDILESKKIGKLTKLKNLIFKTIFGKYSIQSALFYSKKNANSMKAYIDKIQPDIVILDMIRLSRYHHILKDYQGIKVINLDDLLSLRYERQYQEVNQDMQIGGQYTKQTKGFMKRLISFNFLKRLTLKFEASRVKHEERLTTKHFDHAYFISEKESLIYNVNYHTQKGVSITMGVDTTYFGENLNIPKVKNRLVFLGNYHYSANVESLKMIVDKVFPFVESKVELLAVGPVSDEVKKKFIFNPNVIFTGEVKDLRTEVLTGEIFLVPIAYGTGIKTKVVEGLAMGMPIITNSLGIEGLMVENFKEVMVADNPETIALYIDKLLNDEPLRETLGQNAKAYALKNHTWELIWKDLEKIGFKKDER